MFPKSEIKEFYKPNYIEKLKSVSVDDLSYMEKDLSFRQKVSLAFILFGSSIANVHYILQKLIVLSKSPTSDSDILFSYTKINSNWKPFLVEALAIIKATRVLKKLGFAYLDLKAVFLPHIAQIALHVNPILKALYFMIESLTPAETGRLILDVNERQSNNVPFYDHSYMEIFLLDWMCKSIINIGTNASVEELSVPTNLDVLLQALKVNEFESQKIILQEALKHYTQLKTDDKTTVNIQQEPTIKLEKKKIVTEPNVHFNVRDSAANNVQCSQTFERKESCTLNSNDNYVVRKEIAGFALIINQNEFHREENPDLQDLLPKKPLKVRKGTDMDKNVASSVFASFGYVSIERDNLTHYEILDILREVVKRSIVYDSLVVCILSHGVEGVVYGSNSIPVKIATIEHILAADSLLGKPKMLVIQACQGDQLQKAKTVNLLESDGPTSISVPAFSDMITAKSTVPGFASYRHTEKGSWFIQSLCKKIDELGDSRHVLDILTSVAREVTNKRGLDNECMVPITSQTLRKSFFLPRRF